MTPTIQQVALTIDEMVANTPSNDPFSMEATLFGCDDDGAYILASGRDPYEVLCNTPKPSRITAMAFVVTGWASPTTDNDTPPSQHPERIRIRLVTAVGYDGFATVMRRADQPDEVEDMGDEGEGALRDALEAWWAK
jgi:hypothetical protein